MGKGYADGPATEERLADLERAERDKALHEVSERPAVYGATVDNPEKHFLGWLGDVDPDELFTSGKAWGISIVRTGARTPTG
jgi:hypothetical protein